MINSRKSVIPRRNTMPAHLNIEIDRRLDALKRITPRGTCLPHAEIAAATGCTHQLIRRIELRAVAKCLVELAAAKVEALDTADAAPEAIIKAVAAYKAAAKVARTEYPAISAIEAAAKLLAEAN